MLIELDRAKIVDLMNRVQYGYHYLVVAADGSHRIEWVANQDDVPASHTEYAALIPAGLYDDEQEGVARKIIDAHIWTYITDSIHYGALFDPVTHARSIYGEEWRQETLAAVEQAADRFLQSLNDPDEHATWGFDALEDGEYLVRHPPFIVCWASE